MPDFQQKQYAFAAHIRDPQHVPAPDDIEDRRMAVYRELFFNNLLSLLSSTFPVLAKIHKPEKWRQLVRQFMMFHVAETPYFMKIPMEFLTFLQSDRLDKDANFPFLVELAHYEWIELELSVSTAENDLRNIDPDGDFLKGVPVASQLVRSCVYEYPVQQISAEFLPGRPGEQPTYIAVFRKSNDDLGFMVLNPITARLLQLIVENEHDVSGEALLRQLAEELSYSDVEMLLAHGNDAMHQLRQSEILVGTLISAA